MSKKAIDGMNGHYFQDTELRDNVLKKDNMREYTPVNDYNPATKKYADDKISSIINNNVSSSTSTYSSDTIDKMFDDIKKYIDEIFSSLPSNAIEIIKQPNKTTYYEGDYFEPDGIQLKITYNDTTEIINDISNIIVPTNPLTLSDTYVTITCIYQDTTFEINVQINVKEFNADLVLVDFNFTNNGNNTYTLTAWKGTLNGIPSTEVVIPNNSKIIL